MQSCQPEDTQPASSRPPSLTPVEGQPADQLQKTLPAGQGGPHLEGTRPSHGDSTQNEASQLPDAAQAPGPTKPAEPSPGLHEHHDPDATLLPQLRADTKPSYAVGPSYAQGDSDATVNAPSFPPLPSRRTSRSKGGVAVLPEAGERIDDFLLKRVLGRGAFGTVFLARQVSLDRDVALKVGANMGSEGRTMARLEHPNIVQVYSEAVDPSGSFRLLCMQLVSGAALDRVIESLHSTGAPPPSLSSSDAAEWPDEGKGVAWQGADYLAAIDQLASLSSDFDAAALRDRERFAESDRVQTTAWVIARLAEALAFAHGVGVLHRDIKPANVLVDRYGRPLLADFNIAHRSEDAVDRLGGTIAYMSPEHLRAFAQPLAKRTGEVDHRSDLYSLGAVAIELLRGRSPLASVARSASRAAHARALAEARAKSPPPVGDGPNDAEKIFVRTVARALAPDPADRFQDGRQMARALDGCHAQATALRGLPAGGWPTRAACGRPFLWLMVFAIAPQIVGSAINITYNAQAIVGRLETEQESLFIKLVIGYNLVAYPLLVTLGFFVVYNVFAPWQKLQTPDAVDPDQIDAARRKALNLPLWMLGLAAAGWLPGGVLFPAVIAVFEPPLGLEVFFHFVISFTLSGLVAAAYSFGGLQFLVLRGLYPRFWATAEGFSQKTRQELVGVGRRLALVQMLAGSVPLVAAVLVFDSSIGRALVGVGTLGMLFAARAARLMGETVMVLTGKRDP